MQQQPKQNKPPLVIGSQQILMIIMGIVIVALGAILIAMLIAISKSNQPEEIPLEPTPVLIESDAQGADFPTDTPPPTIAVAPTLAPTVEVISHEVQAGETLTSIAASYGVNIQTILDANSLTLNSTVFSGQKINIPLRPDAQGTWHEVKFGETIITIAESYGVSADQVQTTNSLSDINAIFIGQRIYIPVPAQSAGVEGDNPPVTPTSDPLLEDGPLRSTWARSIYEGDLEENYPLIASHERFTLHYQPGTYSEQNLEVALNLINDSLLRAEANLGTHMGGTFDVYMAGTLFEHPDGSLRGFSESPKRRLFILFDGSGDEAENAYLATHELTHMVAWNTWGTPSSMILSEGMATYSGQAVLEAGGYMPYDQLCVGAYAAGVMSSMAVIERDFQVFQGHNKHRFNYFGSGCFAGYLVETYGLETMSALYDTSDYQALYGKSLIELDAEWQASLAAQQGNLSIDAQQMVDYTNEWLNVSTFVFKNYNGTDLMHRAYAAIDRARIALWKGDYAEVRRWLDEVYAMTGYTR